MQHESDPQVETGAVRAPMANRRRFLRASLVAAGSLAAGGLLAACAPAATPSPTAAPAKPAGTTAPAAPAATAAPAQKAPAQAAAKAAPSELLVINQPAFQTSIDKYAIPKMKELYNVDVKSTGRLSGEALTKAIAQKDNPDVSVFMMDEGPWLQGKEAGVWDKIDEAGIPNLKKLPPQFRDADGFGTGYAIFLLGLLFDRDELKKANVPVPESMFDLWKPELKGHVTLQSFNSTFAFVFLSQVERALGGDPTRSLDQGFAKIKELAPSVSVFHGSTTQLNQIFQQKQAWVGYTGNYIAQQLETSGLPVGWRAPKEGAAAVVTYMAVARNAPNMPAARQFLDLILAEETQRNLAEASFGAPINPETRLDPAFAKTFTGTQDVVKGAHPVPWSVYNARRTELNERWQREIESR